MPPETTGKFAAATFEHDTARPVDGYAAPQLHTHAVIFNVTERENGQTRSMQSHELYASQHYGTAIYRAELATRLQKLGYELERGKDGQPEIKGYTREYLDASSPRRQQVQDYKREQGIDGAAAGQIAAHRTPPPSPTTTSSTSLSILSIWKGTSIRSLPRGKPFRWPVSASVRAQPQLRLQAAAWL